MKELIRLYRVIRKANTIPAIRAYKQAKLWLETIEDTKQIV